MVRFFIQSAILAACIAMSLGSRKFMRGFPQNVKYSIEVEERRKLNNVPPEWICDDSLYGTNDGCDCGCGYRDPDCEADAENEEGNADLYCYDNGDELDVETSELICQMDPNDPTVAECAEKYVPPEWTCQRSFYEDGGCDCGCGAWDPDCDETQTGMLCYVEIDEPLIDDSTGYMCSTESFKCVIDTTTNRPTGNPTPGATSRPTGNPTPGDTARPTGNPTPGATSRPSTSPPSSSMPSSAPTESDGGLSPGTTSRPTGNPTRGGTQRPTGNPTPGGTSRPTGNPTPGATERPTVEGETERPTPAA